MKVYFMARKKDSPQKAALREMMGNYLKENNVKVKDGTDVNSIMRDMMSIILEGALDQELDEELGYSRYDYRNTVTQDMEEKIISMYAKGMTTGDIEAHLRDLYDLDISDSTISRITDKIMPLVKEWQERPLQEIYAVVYMDAIHYHVRSEGRIVKRAVYIALGIDMDGKKDVIACVDGLNGFPQAIEAVYPKTEIQQCIIHQIRNTTNYVSYKDLKKLMADLKMVYAVPDEATALDELESFGEKWNNKYPKIYKSWSKRWATLSTYFKYPNEVRKLIYTTNAIEGFNRQLRKVTKSRTVFPSDDSLLKMLYLATMDITKKWTGRRRDWSQIRAQLEIFFEDRLERL